MGINVIPANIFQFVVDINLDNFEQYAMTLEDLLVREQKQFDSRVKEAESKWQGQDRNEFYSMYEDDYWRLSEIFPNLLRSSFFITCYSFLEHTLLDLCGYFQKKYKYTVELPDLAGKGIFKARTYLKKVVGIDFPDQFSSWADIVIFTYIRNFIVHNDGQLDKSNHVAEVKSFINQRQWISVDTLHERIQFTGNYYQKIIDILRKFFDELFAAISRMQIPQP